MDKITHEMRLTNWKRLLEECQARPQGMTAKQWLKENNISPKQYYYWQRQIRKEAYAQMKTALVPAEENIPAVFAEIPAREVIPQNTGEDNGFRADVIIKTSRMTVSVSNTASDALLNRLMEVVRHAG